MEANMRTITIALRHADFAAEMAKMRSWLDQHMFNPEKFFYKQTKEIITISVDFLSDHHAEAFKNHFNGREPDANVLLKNEFEAARGGVGQRRTMGIPGTMAQACWWRLL